MAIEPRRLSDTFAVLTPALGVEPVEVTPTLYAELDQNFDAFRGHVLVSMHEFGGDWPTWEKHPAGDEIVMLWSGRGTLVLRSGTGEETVALGEPGAYVVVPRGTWHTARIAEPTRMLFITPGEGHRESRAARLSAS